MDRERNKANEENVIKILTLRKHKSYTGTICTIGNDLKSKKFCQKEKNITTSQSYFF